MIVKAKNVLIAVLFVILVFITCLDKLSNIGILKFFLKHIDEIITLLMSAYVVFHFNMVFRKNTILSLLWMVFMSVGGVSTIIYHYQGVVPALIDALLLVNRFVVSYLFMKTYLQIHPMNISGILVKCAKVLSVGLFVLGVINIFIYPVFPNNEFRYFAHSQQLMFTHPTYLAAAEATLLILLGYKNEKNKMLPYMIMCTIIGCFTFRSKAIGFFMVYWFMYVIIIVMKNKKYWLTILFGGVAAAYFAKDQIETYYIQKRFSPRMILMKDGFELLKKHFPFGTGFGSFGSSIAADYYSPIYKELGYEEYRGMNPKDTMFLTDGFWSTILGQFGALGLISFVSVIVVFIKSALGRLKVNRMAGFSMLLIIIYELIMSMAESSFFNPTAMLLFLLYAIFECERDECNV